MLVRATQIQVESIELNRVKKQSRRSRWKEEDDDEASYTETNYSLNTWSSLHTEKHVLLSADTSNMVEVIPFLRLLSPPIQLSQSWSMVISVVPTTTTTAATQPFMPATNDWRKIFTGSVIFELFVNTQFIFDFILKFNHFLYHPYSEQHYKYVG